MKVGIIGCGNISGAYFGGAQKTDVLKIQSCADIRMEAVRSAAGKYGCQAVTVDELLADPEIELGSYVQPTMLLGRSLVYNALDIFDWGERPVGLKGDGFLARVTYSNSGAGETGDSREHREGLVVSLQSLHKPVFGVHKNVGASLYLSHPRVSARDHMSASAPCAYYLQIESLVL